MSRKVRGVARACALVTTGALTLGTVFAGTAGATGSVVATDRATEQVGGALATCIRFDDATNVQNAVYRAVPGVGVVHGQAFYFGNRKQRIARQLQLGRRPRQIIADMIRFNVHHPEWTRDTLPIPRYRRSFDDLKEASTREFQGRQYLIASTRGAPAAWTGQDPSFVGVPHARGHERVKAARGRFRGIAGGNTLTSDTVLRRMRSTFARPPSIVATLEQMLEIDIPPAQEAMLRKGDLAEHLFLTLANSFRDGEGDHRCTQTGTSSSLAWVRVDAPDGSTPINLRWSTRDPAGGDAVVELARLYYECRVGIGPCDTAVVGR